MKPLMLCTPLLRRLTCSVQLFWCTGAISAGCLSWCHQRLTWKPARWTHTQAIKEV